MRTLKSLILTAILISVVFCSSVFALSVSVDRNSLAYGDYLTVTVRVPDKTFPRSYDLVPLQKSFTVLARRIVDRQGAEKGVWLPYSYMVLDIAPKHSGQLFIPALQIGAEKSKPVAVTVNYAADDFLQDGKLLNSFLIANVDVTSPYLEQQVVYTVKLFSQQMIHDGELQNPDVKGALVHRLGQDRRYEIVINNKKYRVFIRRYAMFPLKSGELQIIPSIFTGKVGNLGDRKELRLVAPLIGLRVQPVPAQFNNKWWVPAKELSISASWLPAKPVFRVGETVTRVLTVRGVGLTALQLPEIDQGRLANVHTSAKTPISKSFAFGVDAVGIWQRHIKFTPIRVGKVVVPVIQLQWWNTIKQQPEVAYVPAMTIDVATSGIGSQSSVTALTDIVSPSRKLGKSPVDLLLEIAHFWLWLVLVLFFLALIGSLIWAVKKKHIIQREKELAIDEGRQRSLRLARQLVQEAALANDARQTRNAMLKWAELRWSGQVFLGLPNVIDILDDKDMKAAIAELQRALYSEAQLQWNGVEFWNTFEDQGCPIKISALN